MELGLNPRMRLLGRLFGWFAMGFARIRVLLAFALGLLTSTSSLAAFAGLAFAAPLLCGFLALEGLLAFDCLSLPLACTLMAIDLCFPLCRWHLDPSGWGRWWGGWCRDLNPLHSLCRGKHDG